MMILNDKKAYHSKFPNQRSDSNPYGTSYQIPRITTKTKYAISFLCLFDGLRTPSIRRLVRKPNILCDKPVLTFDPSFYAPSSKSAMKEIYSKSLDVPCDIAVDPSVQTVLALLRRYTSSLPPQRVILHYCGYGVLQPNKEGCIFFFTEDRQRYKPLKIQNIVNACACPICLIIDCPNAAALKPHLLGRPDFFAFFSCAQGESLPISMDAPLDIFSSCLLKPFEAALNFHQSPRQHNSVFTEQLMPIEEHHDFLLSLFNSILDSIIFETQEGEEICNEIVIEMNSKSHHGHSNSKKNKTSTQFLNMISPTIASLTKGFAVAQRVMLSFNLHPTAIPELRPMATNHLWEFWDLVLDFAATVSKPGELEKMVFALFIESFKKFPRLAHIPMFSLWIEKECFADIACQSLLEFLEASDSKNRHKTQKNNLQTTDNLNQNKKENETKIESEKSSASLNLNLNDSDQENGAKNINRSIIFASSDLSKETKVLNEFRFNNKSFISYSDFDEYDKFNDLSYNEISDSYYSEGNEEEESASSGKKKQKEEESDASASSYDDEEYEKELICFDSDFINDNLYECVMLGRDHHGINLSLFRSRMASLSPIVSKIIESQNHSPASLLILAKIIASTSVDINSKRQSANSTVFPPNQNQQNQLNFSILKKTDELKIGMLVTCCEMKKQDIPSSFNQITQTCINHLEECAPFSLILLGILLDKGGKLAFSTACATFSSNDELAEQQNSKTGFNSMVSEKEVDNLNELADEDDDEELVDNETLFFDKFEKFLSSQRTDVRASAVFAIGKSKEHSKKAIDKLVSILSNENEDNLVRSQVLYALASFEQYFNHTNKGKKSLFSDEVKCLIQKVVEKEKEMYAEKIKNKNKNDSNENELKNLLIYAANDLKKQVHFFKLNDDPLNQNQIQNPLTFQSPSIMINQRHQQMQRTKQDFVNPFLDFLLTCVASEGFSDTMDSDVFNLLPYR